MDEWVLDCVWDCCGSKCMNEVTTQIITRQKFLCIFPGTIICPGSVQLRARDIKWRLLASHATCIIADANTAETVDQVKMRYSIIILYRFRVNFRGKKSGLASICATRDWVRNTWNVQWTVLTHMWPSSCILMDASWIFTALTVCDGHVFFRPLTGFASFVTMVTDISRLFHLL